MRAVRPHLPPRVSRHVLAPAAVTIAALALGAPVHAHDLGTTETLVTIGANRFEIVMLCDLDALALGAGPGADDSALAAELEGMDAAELDALKSRLREMFARRVRLFADGQRLEFEVDFPDRPAGRTLSMVPPTFLGLTAQIVGSLPADPGELRFRLSRAFPAAELTVIDANGRTLLAELVPRGEDSSTFGVLGDESRDASPPRELGWLLGGASFVLAGWLLWRGSRGSS